MNLMVQCPECQAALPDGFLNREALSPCPVCTVPLRVEVFPAFYRRVAPGRTAEAIVVDGESSCFYHPQKKAVLPCESCGRFLCALCDCELNGQHFCPSCLETGRTKGKIKNLENQRTLYDTIALRLAMVSLLLTVSIFFAFVALITAPMTLYVVIRYWKSPLSIVRRSRFRFVIAGLLAGLQIAMWVFIIVLGITHRHLKTHG